MNEYTTALVFSDWLAQRVIDDARGTGVDRLETAPSGRHWLGKLATEEAQMRMDMGERGERLDPCAMGIRLQPVGVGPWRIDIKLTFATWSGSEDDWHKQGPTKLTSTVETDGEGTYLTDELCHRLEELSGTHLLSAELRVETVPGLDRSKARAGSSAQAAALG